MGPPPQVFGILLDDPLKHETLGKAARLALTAWLDGASEDLQKRSQLMAHHPEIATDLEQEFRRLTLIEKALHPGSARDEATLGTEVEEARSDAAFFILRCIRCGFSSGRIEQPELQSRALKTCPKCDFGPLVLEASDRLYAGKLIHQYRLQSPLGSGGFGSVWLAFDESLERQVALKIPHAKIATEAEREVFFREAKIAASVRHPMVVAVHDVGYFEDTVYICMEYLEGPTLTEWKLPHNNRSDAACELLQRLCEPVQAIHEAGIIHRDLKPSNIMIDDHGFPRLTDFGIAKPLDRQTQLTLTGQVLGTPSYMAPELAVGDAKHADARSDIYSMGVILYELLTEKLPLQIQTRADLDQIHKQKVPPPRSWNPSWNIPPDLEAICLKCLQKNPNDRYRHVSELADDLKRLGAGQPVLATPSSLTTSCYHYFQTRPTARLLGLLFLLTACVIPSLSMLIKRRGDVLVTNADRQHDQAQDDANNMKSNGVSFQALVPDNKTVQMQFLKNGQLAIGNLEQLTIFSLAETMSRQKPSSIDSISWQDKMPTDRLVLTESTCLKFPYERLLDERNQVPFTEEHRSQRGLFTIDFLDDRNRHRVSWDGDSVADCQLSSDSQCIFSLDPHGAVSAQRCRQQSAKQWRIEDIELSPHKATAIHWEDTAGVLLTETGKKVIGWALDRSRRTWQLHPKLEFPTSLNQISISGDIACVQLENRGLLQLYSIRALQSADEQAALLAQFACDALHDIFLPRNKESLYLACTVQGEYQWQRWTFANQKLEILRSCKTEASAQPRFVIHPDRELAAVIDSEVHILNSNQGTLASITAAPSNVGPVSWLGSSPDLALANGKGLTLIHIDEPWQDQWTAVPVVREQAKIKSIITDPRSTYCSIFTTDGQIQLYDFPRPK